MACTYTEPGTRTMSSCLMLWGTMHMASVLLCARPCIEFGGRPEFAVPDVQFSVCRTRAWCLYSISLCASANRAPVSTPNYAAWNITWRVGARGPNAAITYRLLDWQSRQVVQETRSLGIPRHGGHRQRPATGERATDSISGRQAARRRERQGRRVRHRSTLGSHSRRLAHSVTCGPTMHRLSRTIKLRLYRVCVCSSLTHCCEACTLNRTVMRSVNGFNSRCLHVMTGQHYRETATAQAYDLVLAMRRRCLRYRGHVLRMPADRMVWCTRIALMSDSIQKPAAAIIIITCGNVVESSNVARQSGIAIVNMRV